MTSVLQIADCGVLRASSLPGNAGKMPAPHHAPFNRKPGIENQKSLLACAFLSFVLGGCGTGPTASPKPELPPGPAAGADSAGGSQESKPARRKSETRAKPVKTALLQREDFVVKGEGPAAALVADCVATSPLWKIYLESRAGIAQAKRPFVQFDVTTRQSEYQGRPAILVHLVATDLLLEKSVADYVAAQCAEDEKPASQAAYDELLGELTRSDKTEALVARAAFKALFAEGGLTPAQFAEAVEQHPEFMSAELVQEFMNLGPEAPVAFRVLGAAINSSDGETQAAALDAFLKVKPLSKEAVPVLAKLLEHSSQRVRLQALENLARLGPPAAEALVNALANPNVEVQAQAETALLALGPACPEVQAQIPHLAELSMHCRGFARRLTMRVLSLLGGEGGLKAFADALGDEDADIWKPASGYLWPLASKAKPALPELRRALIGPNRELRFFVLEVLKAIGPDARDVIALALQDPGPVVRLEAARALAGFGPGGTALIAHLANDSDYRMRNLVRAALNPASKGAPVKAATAANAKPARTRTLVLKNGKIVSADEIIDVGEGYVVKTTGKQYLTIEKKDVEKITDSASEKVAPAVEPKAPPGKSIVMKDGKKIAVEKIVDAGESYVVKTPSGQYLTIEKKDVEKLEGITAQ